MKSPSTPPIVIPTSISRTALDSLHAKLSAVECGWLDGGVNEDNEDNSRVGRSGNGTESCMETEVGQSRIGTDDNDDGKDDSNHDSNGNLTALRGGSNFHHPLPVYTQLLHKIHNGVQDSPKTTDKTTPITPIRRQTPLVNAGYAARITVTTHLLERWVTQTLKLCIMTPGTMPDKPQNPNTPTAREEHSGENSEDRDNRHPPIAIDSKFDCLNVILLGCGLDPLGVWSNYIFHNFIKQICSNSENSLDSNQFPTVKVYEFDAEENCRLKRLALLNSGLLQETNNCGNDAGLEERAEEEANSNEKFRIVSEGKISLDDLGICHNETGDDYFLLAVDLRGTTDPCEPTSSDGDSSMKCETHEEGGRNTKPVLNGKGHDRNQPKPCPKSILSRATGAIGLDDSQPTLVLSELVLAYLGYEGANAVLRSVADIVEINQSSMFVCLEPMLPSIDLKEQNGNSCNASRVNSEGGGSINIVSVQEGYAKDYSRQFLNKLQCGNSTNNNGKHHSDNSNDTSSSWFHPLGANEHAIQSRLKSCGFSSTDISCASLGTAVPVVSRLLRGTDSQSKSDVSIIGPMFLRAKEPFDEHAALALNLGCYGVVCAFSSALPNSCSISSSTRNDICPWWEESRYTVECMMEPLHRQPSMAMLIGSLKIRPIRTLSEDVQVATLFGETYTFLYEEYPIVQKMVNAALQGDLRTESPGHSLLDQPSIVRKRYLEEDGEFWVVTFDEDSGDHDSPGEMRSVEGESAVAGSIGILKRKKKEIASIDETTPTQIIMEYEVQRVLVNGNYRGMGIGKKLLQIVEEFAVSAEKDTDSTHIELCATTLERLTVANKLYLSAGYERAKIVMAGKLQMNLYCKKVSL